MKHISAGAKFAYSCLVVPVSPPLKEISVPLIRISVSNPVNSNLGTLVEKAIFWPLQPVKTAILLPPPIPINPYSCAIILVLLNSLVVILVPLNSLIVAPGAVIYPVSILESMFKPEHADLLILITSTEQPGMPMKLIATLLHKSKLLKTSIFLKLNKNSNVLIYTLIAAIILIDK